MKCPMMTISSTSPFITLIPKQVLALLVFFLHFASAIVQMPKWFGNNMVLQTNAEYGARSFLNGKATPGELVSVQIAQDENNIHNSNSNRTTTSTYQIIADSKGDWLCQLNPSYYYRGELSIEVSGNMSSPDSVVSAHNVTFGDVFFCSGQSNMVYPLKLAFNATQEAATLEEFPNFRFFVTSRSTADHPQWDLNDEGRCDNIEGSCNRWMLQSEAMGQFILEFSAVCFMTVRDVARLHDDIGSKRPIALIQSAWGGTRVEAWMSKEAIANTPFASNVPPPKNTYNHASCLYNGMIHPWKNFALRAVLWYQGEANADQDVEGVDKTIYYSSMYQAMIADWRLKKGMGDFCWGTVQLPPSLPSETSSTNASNSPAQTQTGRAEIRLAQYDSRPRPHSLTDISAVAVTLDLGGSGERGIDHPPNKNEMSRRLALGIFHAAYAQQKPLWTGPILETVDWNHKHNNNNRAQVLRLSFQPNTCKGMKLRDVKGRNADGTSNDCHKCCSKAPPFEVKVDSKAEKWWTVPYTSIQIHDDDKQYQVVLDLSNLKMTTTKQHTITAVRYAWSDYVDCVLENSDGLVASPFVHPINMTTSLIHPTITPSATKVRLRKSLAKNVSSSSLITNTLKGRIISRNDDANGHDAPNILQSPPMGFNSWNFYHCNIDENTVKAIADSMVKNGMKEVGYRYVNIDDCWQVGRHSNGTIQVDPARFPSGMKDLADYVHSLGLRLGVYTARGSRTCQGRPGSYTFEEIDAETYCDWGIDYLKNDNCGGSNWPQVNTSWIKFRKGFDACQARTGRPMILSVEYCRLGDECEEWIADVANVWRTTGDIQVNWDSVMYNIHKQEPMYRIARPGHFNDPDMIQVGNVGLTLDEQYSHMALWCIAGAPLLIGTDLIHASQNTLDILTNPEVVAVNQDLGWRDKEIQGHIISGSTRNGGPEIWGKRLADGSWAVVLLNTDSSESMNATVHWVDLGLAKDITAVVRDLWGRQDVGKYKEKYTTVDLQPHQSAFVRVTSTQQTPNDWVETFTIH